MKTMKKKAFLVMVDGKAVEFTSTLDPKFAVLTRIAGEAFRRVSCTTSREDLAAKQVQKYVSYGRKDIEVVPVVMVG